MKNFNKTLIEYLDRLNHVLAVVFALLMLTRFFELVGTDIIGAFLESLSVLGVGIMTCGFIALLCSINQTLNEISSKLGR